MSPLNIKYTKACVCVCLYMFFNWHITVIDYKKLSHRKRKYLDMIVYVFLFEIKAMIDECQTLQCQNIYFSYIYIYYSARFFSG